MSIVNKSSVAVSVAVDGRLVAASPAKGPAAMSWQAPSSAVNSPPFRTSHYPLLGVGGERLHLTSHGGVRALDLRLYAGYSPGERDCAVSVRPTRGAVTVAAAGDIACDPDAKGYNRGRGVAGRCHQRATSDVVKDIDPDAVFALGDLQYQAGTLANFRASYDPTWGRFKDITYPIVGDHEYGDPEAAGYFAYFGARATPQDLQCDSGCRGYYSFDLGAWHVIALNVICDKLPAGDGCSTESPQNRWLQHDLELASKTTACTVVLMHEPRWSSSHKQSPQLAPFVTTMYKNGVDLILSGSSHTYERFAPQNPTNKLDLTAGITQIVVGTGGAHFTGFLQTQSNSQVRRSNVFGVLELTLQDAAYSWSFRPDPSTPFNDSGHRACH